MIDEHEVYVKRETADLLRKAGFDWTVSHGYLTSSGMFTSGHFSNNSDYGVSAPTLDVAQRWLREVKEVDVIVTYEAVVNKKTSVYEKKYAVVIYDAFINKDTDYHDTYEEAQEAGIKTYLTNLLKQKNGQNS